MLTYIFYIYNEGDYISVHNDHHVGQRVDVQLPVTLGTVAGVRVLSNGFLRTHYDTVGAMNVPGTRTWSRRWSARFPRSLRSALIWASCLRLHKREHSKFRAITYLSVFVWFGFFWCFFVSDLSKANGFNHENTRRNKHESYWRLSLRESQMVSLT